MKIQTQKDVAKIFTPERVEMMNAKIAPADPVNGCREWMGTVDREGYPLMYVRQKGKSQTYFRVHRALWVLNNRKDVPRGMEVHHGCHNRRCLNAEHLELADRAEQVTATWKTLKPNGKLGRVGHGSPEHVRMELARLRKIVAQQRRDQLEEAKRYDGPPAEA